MQTEIPKINAMLVCDRVITEAVTNKKSLIGIFENISAQVFPCRHSGLSVYVKFTDCSGKYLFRLELVDLIDDKVLAKAVIPDLEVTDKLGAYELVFNFINLDFFHPGKYEFRIFANDRFFGSKAINLMKTNMKNIEI